MTEEIFLVAFDGKDRKPVECAIVRAKRDSARLHIVHVLEWSPYSFLTPEELAERHKQRQEELSRAKDAVLDPILAAVRAAGVAAEGEIRYGSAVDLICAIARERAAALIFVGRSAGLSARVFGSTAMGLAQCAPVPTVIVP